jgi:hypothetical protein
LSALDCGDDSLPFQTDERLKGYLDTNQLHREQLCLAVLALDKRFSQVTPRHPRGGPDGGRDIQAIYKDDQVAFGAVGFVNQANDSQDKKKQIKAKFELDLKSALEADHRPGVFIFLTNINMTVGEKDELSTIARAAGIDYCDVFDRERLRIVLDSPDGLSARFQFLGLPLSEAEQATFFARWGDDIQSMISNQFDSITRRLDRIIFLQESVDHLNYFGVLFKLDKLYQAVEIGHFRAFCSLLLKEVKHDTLQILFGATDKAGRDTSGFFTDDLPGIAAGIVGGQWEYRVKVLGDVGQSVSGPGSKDKWTRISKFSSVGVNELESIYISYRRDELVRFQPHLSLKDLDESMLMPMVNKSLADKISSIVIYANGYELKRIERKQFLVDQAHFEPLTPLEFTQEELKDPWARIRPQDSGSSFTMSFGQETPKRLFAPKDASNKV